MKILFLSVFPLFGNGSGNYTRKLGEQLVKEGHDVAIAAPEKHSIKGLKIFEINPYKKAVFESHPEWKRAKRYVDLPSKDLSKIYLSYLRQITEIVEKFQPDIIHVNHCFFLTWIANYIKSIYRTAFVVTAHGTEILQVSKDQRFRRLTTQALQASSAIIAVSPHTKKWLLKVFKGIGLKRKPRVITGGIDFDSWSKDAPIKIINKKYNIKDKKVIIFVGRLTKEKGIEYLIKSAKKIKAEIFIIGGGVEKRRLMDYARKTEATNIHFLGYFGKEYIEELREFYRKADVLVLPSVVDESLGLVLLEAMACETPVVASNKGGIPLAVKDKINGYLIRAKSSKQITEKVNWLLNNPEKSAVMGKNARQLIQEKFSWQSISPKIVKIYETTNNESQTLRKKYQILDQTDIEKQEIELNKKIGYVS